MVFINFINVVIRVASVSWKSVGISACLGDAKKSLPGKAIHCLVSRKFAKSGFRSFSHFHSTDFSQVPSLLWNLRNLVACKKRSRKPNQLHDVMYIISIWHQVPDSGPKSSVPLFS